MEYTLLLEQFKVLKNAVRKDLSSIELPDSSSDDEATIFENVKTIRKHRNILLKHQLKLRSIQREFKAHLEEQKTEDAKNIQSLFVSSENLKGLKTKDERDMVIRAFIFKSRKPDEPDFKQIYEEVTSVLEDTILAVSELQKAFDEYQLIFNFSRQAAMGYLLSEAHHKLNDVVK